MKVIVWTILLVLALGAPAAADTWAVSVEIPGVVRHEGSFQSGGGLTFQEYRMRAEAGAQYMSFTIKARAGQRETELGLLDVLFVNGKTYTAKGGPDREKVECAFDTWFVRAPVHEFSVPARLFIDDRLIDVRVNIGLREHQP